MESHYNKNFQQFSRKLRQEATPGEKKLWNEVLKGKKLLGFQFNRQFAIENYIVDFVCRTLKLVVEIDGYSHNFKSEQDQVRDKILIELGFTVIRITENQVMNDLQNVIRIIEISVTEKIKSIPQPPSPRVLDELENLKYLA